MNPFEQGRQKIIPATLIYAFSGGKYLMLERNDGIWNGLGGKLELGESPLQGAVREFSEESGFNAEPEQFTWMGFLAFPNFKAHKCEDWWVHVFIVDLGMNHGIPGGKKMPEGVLHWKTPDEILKLGLWDGDQKFLPLVFDRKPFHGTFWYENGHMSRHVLQLIQSKT